MCAGVLCRRLLSELLLLCSPVLCLPCLACVLSGCVHVCQMLAGHGHVLAPPPGWHAEQRARSCACITTLCGRAHHGRAMCAVSLHARHARQPAGRVVAVQAGAGRARWGDAPAVKAVCHSRGQLTGAGKPRALAARPSPRARWLAGTAMLLIYLCACAPVPAAARCRLACSPVPSRQVSETTPQLAGWHDATDHHSALSLGCLLTTLVAHLCLLPPVLLLQCWPRCISPTTL